jgi:hypothetical protein
MTGGDRNEAMRLLTDAANHFGEADRSPTTLDPWPARKGIAALRGAWGILTQLVQSDLRLTAPLGRVIAALRWGERAHYFFAGSESRRAADELGAILEPTPRPCGTSTSPKPILESPESEALPLPLAQCPPQSELAAELRRLNGLGLITLPANDKHYWGSWEVFYSRPVTEADYRAWGNATFKQIQLLLGEGVSRDLCILDLDSQGAIKWYREGVRRGDIPDSPLKASTGKGMHVYYRRSKPLPCKRQMDIFKEKQSDDPDKRVVDIIPAGCLVIPPSKYMNPKITDPKEKEAIKDLYYRWIGEGISEGILGRLPEFPVAILSEAGMSTRKIPALRNASRMNDEGPTQFAMDTKGNKFGYYKSRSGNHPMRLTHDDLAKIQFKLISEHFGQFKRRYFPGATIRNGEIITGDYLNDNESGSDHSFGLKICTGQFNDFADSKIRGSNYFEFVMLRERIDNVDDAAAFIAIKIFGWDKLDKLYAFLGRNGNRRQLGSLAKKDAGRISAKGLPAGLTSRKTCNQRSRIKQH